MSRTSTANSLRAYIHLARALRTLGRVKEAKEWESVARRDIRHFRNTGGMMLSYLRRLLHCEHCNSGEYLQKGPRAASHVRADASGLQTDFFDVDVANAAVADKIMTASERTIACSFCGKFPPGRKELSRCAKCGMTRYCCRQCQVPAPSAPCPR